MTLPAWDGTGDDSWDTVILGPHIMPGIATVEVDTKNQIEKKKAKGKDGATTKDHGRVATPVNITLQLLPRDIPQFLAALPDLQPPRKGGKRTPLDIVHPNTTVAGITAVIVGGIRYRQPTAKGGWKILISAIEWVPKPKTVVSGSKKGAAKKGGAGSCAEIEWATTQAWQRVRQLEADQINAADAGDSSLVEQLDQGISDALQNALALQAEAERCNAESGGSPSQEAEQNL